MENLEPLLPVLIPGTFVLYLVIERVFPGRPQPRVRRWWLTGLAFFVMASIMNAALPALIVQAVHPVRLVDLSALGTSGGALVALLAGDVVGYWIHRGMHRSTRVWRWTHQLHHSAERMDMLGAAFMHPLDFLLANVLPGTLLVSFLGITPAAAALGGFLGFALGVFPHLNVRTPAWLGYVLQRPEMHEVHHTRGVHAYNYGNLAFSDLLFGTWRNPATFSGAPLGFYDGGSARLGAMLAGRDVAEPPRLPSR